MKSFLKISLGRIFAPAAFSALFVKENSKLRGFLCVGFFSFYSIIKLLRFTDFITSPFRRSSSSEAEDMPLLSDKSSVSVHDGGQGEGYEA